MNTMLARSPIYPRMADWQNQFPALIIYFSLAWLRPTYKALLTLPSIHSDYTFLHPPGPPGSRLKAPAKGLPCGSLLPPGPFGSSSELKQWPVNSTINSTTNRIFKRRGITGSQLSLKNPHMVIILQYLWEFELLHQVTRGSECLYIWFYTIIAVVGICGVWQQFM